VINVGGHGASAIGVRSQYASTAATVVGGTHGGGRKRLMRSKYARLNFPRKLDGGVQPEWRRQMMNLYENIEISEVELMIRHIPKYPLLVDIQRLEEVEGTPPYLKALWQIAGTWTDASYEDKIYAVAVALGEASVEDVKFDKGKQYLARVMMLSEQRAYDNQLDHQFMESLLGPTQPTRSRVGGLPLGWRGLSSYI
jgi:hypothetical protein